MSLDLNEICRSYKFWNHCKLYVYNREKTNYLHHNFILTSTLDVRHGHKSEKETLPRSCWFCFNINTSYKCQHPCSCHYTVSQVKKGWSSIYFDFQRQDRDLLSHKLTTLLMLKTSVIQTHRMTRTKSLIQHSLLLLVLTHIRLVCTARQWWNQWHFLWVAVRSVL